MTSAIPVQRSNQLSYQLGAGQLRVRIYLVDDLSRSSNI